VVCFSLPILRAGTVGWARALTAAKGCWQEGGKWKVAGAAGMLRFGIHKIPCAQLVAAQGACMKQREATTAASPMNRAAAAEQHEAAPLCECSSDFQLNEASIV
jgi:hypothetical protein